MGFMSSSVSVLLNGVVVTVAGIGIATAAPAPANSLSDQFSTHRGNFELASGSQRAKDELKSLPESVIEAIFKDILKRSGLTASQLKVLEFESQTWSDGCLGLGGREVVCSQALVPGWRAIIASEEGRWIYRTDESGSKVVLEKEMSQDDMAQSDTEITRQRVTSRTVETVESVGSTSSQSSQTVGGTAQTTVGVSASSQQQAAATRSSVQVSFSDIPQGYWARDFIAELARMDIITGFPDGKFRPNEPVTRAQFAAMIRKAFKKSKTRNVSFRDVSTTHWAYSAIRQACEMGFLGVNNRSQFNPNQSVSRLQVLQSLTQGLNYSYSGSTESILRFYSDATAIPANLRSLVAAATQQGIVVNYPNVRSLSPNMVATRAEVAAFLYQAMVSTGDMIAISSPYVVDSAVLTGGTVESGGTGEVREVENDDNDDDDDKPERRNCNQGIGNGAEGCDPGNSRPHGGSNDEGGRTPGGR